MLNLKMMGRAALFAGLSCVMFNALAAAPKLLEDQVAGYYREKVGDVVVTTVYDGYLDIPTTLLKGMQAKDLKTLMARMFVQDQHGVQTAVNAFLVQTPTNLVLVDSGAALCFGPTAGEVLNNIKAAGFNPDDVDTVLLTHLHPDHSCGISTEDGQTAFPNATVWASEKDAAYWLNEKITAQAAPADQPIFNMTQQAVEPYKAKHLFKTFTDSAQLPDGFSLVPTPGHTPGHSSFLITSKNQSVLIWGDIVHSHSVQMTHPEVAIEYDSDKAKAIETRKHIFTTAAKNGWLVAGAHLPFPGLGHVRKDPVGYSWVPVEFSPLRTDR